MKFHQPGFFLSIICLTALATNAGGDPVPVPKLQFYQAAQGTYNADWQGSTGCTYFMEFSLNLVDWYYAPFIDFGEGQMSRSIHSTSQRFFIRLRCGDYPGIDSLDDALNADFDNDGLSNAFEVTHGYNPFDDESTIGGADASHDPDSDGLGNAAEQLAGGNPMNKDNAILQLEVIVD